MPDRVAICLVGLALAAAAGTLSGCVAAAIPLAAGGLLARSQIERDDGPSGEAQRVASEPPPQLAGMETAQPPAVQPRAAQSSQPSIAPSSTVQPPAAPAGQRASPGAADAFGPLIRYALANRLQGDEPRPSALLANPQAISPERLACPPRQGAVLVDLDPGGERAPLGNSADAAAASAAQLGFALAALRANGVAVVWITDRPASDAGRLRARLVAAGLDPTGADPLLVQRYPGESKQARRQTLGRTHCLLAIAGDARADFDDLFGFLRDPALADPLKPLFDNGWFLTPNPLD